MSLDWEAQLARLEVRRLPDGHMPGDVVRPGLARAHNHAAQLLVDRAAAETVALELAR